MFLLGYDIGSSSVKVALVDAVTGHTIGTAQDPEREMSISSPQVNWAEQDPDDWWQSACNATKKLLAQTRIDPSKIAAIGIAYQMHGLVVVDKHGQVLRPAIIWCDSRAVTIGNDAFEALGEKYCLESYLNTPGNFTASKLRWVQENELEVFEQIDKIMLPGDYIAFKMTGEIGTTITGLSEGIFWDFKTNGLAGKLLSHYKIPERMLPEIVPAFGVQGILQSAAAKQIGLLPGIPIGYRAGDQPNNALSLNVLRPGEVAATGGTSGVVYAVSAVPVYDPKQQVNSFAHVNYSMEKPYTGVLLCINGAGSLYRWMRENLGNGLNYSAMEQHAASVPVGAEGLSILPFGNGAERMLANRALGAQVLGLHFNRHEQRHLYRASLEGIAFAFVHGMEAMQAMDISIEALRVGNDNLFQSTIFSETIATLTGLPIEMFHTNGAIGAAKAAGVSVGIFENPEEALHTGIALQKTFFPRVEENQAYIDAYDRWKSELLRTS